MLTEWGPLAAALAAVIAAGFAYRSSVKATKSKQPVDEATANKIREELRTDQLTNDEKKAVADRKRDRHIIALEEWAFREVRPKWRVASGIVDELNVLLVQLAQRANLPFEPKHMPELAPMPEINDD